MRVRVAICCWVGVMAQVFAQSPAVPQPNPTPPPVNVPAPIAAQSSEKESPKVVPMSGELVAPVKGKADSEDVQFNFSNARLFDVIQQIAQLEGLNYVIDPALKDGTVRIFMNGKLKRNTALDVMGLALKLNGVSVVRNGDFLEFTALPAAASRAATPLVYGSRPVDGLGESFPVTHILPLRFLDVEAFAAFAKEFLSPDGRVTVDKAKNHVILVDYLQQIRRVLAFAELMDRQPFESRKLALFRLKNASPDRLLKDMEPILKAAQVPVGTSALQILPLQSLNALLVVTQTGEWIPDLKGWIERFDEAPRSEDGEIFVLPLRHAKADAVYPLLTQVLRLQAGSAPVRSSPPLANTMLQPARAFGQSPFPSMNTVGGNNGVPGSNIPPQAVVVPTAPPPTPSGSASILPAAAANGPLSPSASITVDVDNNSLLIFGNRSDFTLIESAVSKLDLMPRQVLLEATILDINLSGEFEFGFSGYLREHFNPEDVNVNGFTGGTLNRDIRVDRPTTDAAFTYTGMFTSRFGLLKMVMSAKDSRTLTNVISQPRLWALDNRPARLLVQDQIPIPVNTYIPGYGTGTGSSGYSVTNVQYLDTGLSLTVTPHINASGVIRLEIQQEISNSTGTETIGSGSSQIQAPRVSRRTLSTELITQSGATVVLGGLIQQNRTDVSVGLPLINRIPLIRNLFSSTRKVNQKSELVILLTPLIVSSPEDVDEVTRELKGRVSRAIGENWIQKLGPSEPATPIMPGGSRK